MNNFRIKDKINNPPKDINDQEVSKAFKSFLKLKESVKTGKIKERKFSLVFDFYNQILTNEFLLEIKSIDDDFRSTQIDLDGIRRNANESDQKFLRRVNRITHQRRLEAGFAAKYNVDIIRNQETGEIKLKKRPKDEIEELMKKRRAEAKNGKRKFEDKEPEIVEPKLTSLQKLKLKKKAKKQSQMDEKSRVFSEYQHEVIKFGETVKAPPSLITPRKATKNETVSRPGKRNLLLTTMLGSNKEPLKIKSDLIKPRNKTNKIIKGPIDKKGKRKNLPNQTRLALEAERLNVVDIYRQLKKKQPIVEITKRNIEDF